MRNWLNASEKNNSLNLHSGEIVMVRCRKEIDLTLDENRRMEGLPFMSEMQEYYERRFRVFRRADEVLLEGIGTRRMKNTVILADVTCDGSSHGGCGRTCPVLWKEAWLTRVDDSTADGSFRGPDIDSQKGLVQEGARSCQLVNLKKAAQYPLRARLRALPRRFVLLLGLRSPQSLSPNAETLSGSLRKTPIAYLNLKPGDAVEIKSQEEITSTLDSKGRNRGLAFSSEMKKYCGKQYRVLKRVERMFNENSGEMRSIASTVLLENVNCDGRFHGNCPRNCYCLWREVWLKRV